MDSSPSFFGDRSRLSQLLLLAVAAWTTTYVRTTLSPLQESVKQSLSLSDNLMALLQGVAVAVPIAVVSIPAGLLADRVSRKRILMVSVALTSLGVFFSALASDFILLFIARCLIGIATPGVVVAVYSMASDLVPADQRGRATMLVAVGEIGGAPAAFALGGLLLVAVGTHPGMTLVGQNLENWRWTLLWMGALLVPILLLLRRVHEPARGEVHLDRPPLRAVVLELWRYRAVALPLQLGRAMLFIADGAVYVWGAPLFARKFHLAPDRIGAMMGLALLISGLLGPVLGGPLVDFCQRRGGPSRAVTVLSIFGFVSAPFALFPLLPDATVAAVALTVFLTLGFTIASAALALTLIVIPGELRGLNVGISLVVGSLFFVGLAPLAVSGLSGLVGGEAKIGVALAVVCIVASVLNAGVLSFSARHFPRPNAELPRSWHPADVELSGEVLRK
jgi:MFS family permease